MMNERAIQKSVFLTTNCSRQSTRAICAKVELIGSVLKGDCAAAAKTASSGAEVSLQVMLEMLCRKNEEAAAFEFCAASKNVFLLFHW